MGPLARSVRPEHVYVPPAPTRADLTSSLAEAALSNISERPLAGLTIRIDRDLCVGFGDCIDAGPDVFEFDEESIAVFKEGNPDIDREALLDACSSCPVDALTALDEEGTQLVP